MPDNGSVGSIRLDLNVNTGNIQRDIEGAQVTIQNAFSGTGDMANALRGTISGLGKAIVSAFAVKEIVNFGRECIDLGSDLSEVQNVVDTTFETMSGQVDSFAKSAISSFGLSETMAKRYVGTLGSMADAFGFNEKEALEMSTQLTGLAGDLASFYNISQDAAFTKLKAVYTGETESLKDLGVVMTKTALDAYALANGYGKTTDAMTEQEKVALRYAFVMDQLSNASGDFSKTSGSWANQVRVLSLQFDSLKATLGQVLIAGLTPVIQVLNTLIGKLNEAASAFADFIGIADGETAASGLASGTEAAAENMSATVDGAEELKRTLAGFDKITKLGGDESSTSTATIPTPTTNPTADVKDAAEAAENAGGVFQKIVGYVNELKEALVGGFEIGFGDSEKTIENVKGDLTSIWDTLVGIANDEEVKGGLNDVATSWATGIGKAAGSLTSAGASIAEFVVGGFNGYLEESEGTIKERLASIFGNVSGIFDKTGNAYTSIADIFGVLSSEKAQSALSSFGGIFADTFMGIAELGSSLAADLQSLLFDPVTDNVEGFKTAFEGVFGFLSNIFGTFHNGVQETVSGVLAMYNEHIKPFIENVSSGVSEIVGTILDGWNTYIAPIMDRLSEKFDVVWKEHIQPLFDGVVAVVGKAADCLNAIWTNVLQPLVEWLVSTIYPVLAPIFETIGNVAMDVFSVVADLLSDFVDGLGFVIDFLTSIFTGEWCGIWADVSDSVSQTFSDIMSLVGDAVGWISEKVGGAISAVKELVGLGEGGFWSSAGDMFSSGLSSIGNFFSGEIPHLASGGYVRANTPQLAMIGDNLHQGEVVAPEDKLQAMANEAAGIGNREVISLLSQILLAITSLNLTADIDVNGLRRLIVKLINDNTRATGQCELLT
jgi:phage-related protein